MCTVVQMNCIQYICTSVHVYSFILTFINSNGKAPNLYWKPGYIRNSANMGGSWSKWRSDPDLLHVMRTDSSNSSYIFETFCTPGPNWTTLCIPFRLMLIFFMAKMTKLAQFCLKQKCWSGSSPVSSACWTPAWAWAPQRASTRLHPTT